MTNLLEVSHIYYSLQTSNAPKKILSDITFSINSGQILSIVGPSGCGKTTLISIIAGILKPDSGYVKGSYTSIGYMVQKKDCFEWRSCHNTSGIATETYGVSAYNSYKNLSKKKFTDRTLDLISILSEEPDLIILDDPFYALEYPKRKDVGALINRLSKTLGKTVIFVTNDMADAFAFSDRILVMSSNPGRIQSQFSLDTKYS